MGRKLTFDIRLIRVLGELRTLEEYLGLIEEQINSGRMAAKCELEVDTRGLSPSDCNERSELGLIYQEYYYHINCFLPRISRGPFLVILFSVYESAVKEVAKLIQKSRGQQIALDDIKGNLLNRAKKYYSHVLRFELSRENQRWERLTILLNLRNAIAHTNGRLEMSSEAERKRILRHQEVKEESGFVIVSGAFLRETFTMVKEDLEDLLVRHREWDKANR